MFRDKNFMYAVTAHGRIDAAQCEGANLESTLNVFVQRDLALVRPCSFLNRTVRPLQFSSQDIEVGSDVRANGHPKRDNCDRAPTVRSIDATPSASQP